MMKVKYCTWTAVCLTLAWTLNAALAPGDLTGDWRGTLDTGGVKLRLVFKLSKAAGGGWTAKMDSLDQGVRDLAVDTATVKGDAVKLEVKLVQGVFQGTLQKGEARINGEWTQGPNKLPLELERSPGGDWALEPEKLSPEDTAANKVAAQKAVGVWNGTLAAGPADLRLRVKIVKNQAGAVTGTLQSLDQGTADIPLSAITCKQSTLRFETRGIGGSYEGTLDAKGTTLTGQWRQGGQSLPLKLSKE